MYNHLEDTENVFVLAAHTFCSCVKTTCTGVGGVLLELFTPQPVHVSPIGLPVLPTDVGPYRALYVYDGKTPLGEAADSAPLKSRCSLVKITPGRPRCVHQHVWTKHM